MTTTSIDGKPIINAKKGAKLIITKHDIATADIKQPNNCAVAKACHRVLHAKEVRVHLSRIYVRANEGNWVRYLTPKSLRTEIVSFDRGGTFEPGAYELTAPPPWMKTRKRQGGPDKPGYKKGKGKKRAKHSVVKNVRIGPA